LEVTSTDESSAQKSGGYSPPLSQNVIASKLRLHSDRDHIHPSAVTIEAHMPFDQSEESVVLTHADIGAWLFLCAPLTDEDVASDNMLTAGFLDAETLAVAIATIFD
jgi:hypothetical protein